MKKAVFAIGLIYSCLLKSSAKEIPKLVKNGSYVQLLVDEWSPGAKESIWPLAGGLIIAVATGEFYITGTGFVMTLTPGVNKRKPVLLALMKEDLKMEYGKRVIG